MELVDWLMNIPYLATVLTGLVAAHGLALFIVNLTPTPTDDKWYGIIYKYVELLAGLVTAKAKESAPKAE